MSKGINLIVLGLVSALLITTTMPMAAHAGTLTIYNENCTHLKGLKRKKSVTVTVKAGITNGGCTYTKVKVKTGQSKTISLTERDRQGDICKYRHNAKGTGITDPPKDVKGDEVSSVTCKRDWARVCQCRKD